MATGESFVERRIQQARRAGFFENLALEGKPIPDLHEERPEGWWGGRYLERDRARQRIVELRTSFVARRAAAWGRDDHDALRNELIAMNTELAEANAEADEIDRAELFDVDAELARWRAQRRHRLWGRYLSR